jgi:hypothetical protein
LEFYLQAIFEKSEAGGLQHVNPTHLRMVPSYTTAPTDVEVDRITKTIQGDIEICLARDRASSPVASQIEM